MQEAGAPRLHPHPGVGYRAAAGYDAVTGWGAADGVALLNAGLPGNLVSENTLMLSLLRSHNLGAYGFGGGYEPGMSSETGFELNHRRVLEYALVPHTRGWREAIDARHRSC